MNKIKATAVSHLTDARYFAAWEVHWLGFYLSPGADYSMDVTTAAALREWVDGVRICGEFGLADTDYILERVDYLRLDTVQLDMLTPIAVLMDLKGKVEVIQEVVVSPWSDTDDLAAMLAERSNWVDYFLLDFTKGGLTWEEIAQGLPVSMDDLRHWQAHHAPLIIDAGLPADPLQVARDLPSVAWSVRGGAEEKTGYKSFDELDALFEVIAQ
ncbi:MAG: hypothetical protein R2795_00690 [Saprospiraceae bacterium]